MNEKTKNILRIILTVIDTIIHLFIKKNDSHTNEKTKKEQP